MACVAFLAAELIFLGLLAAAALPFLALRDHRLAVARRRSLYDKSAGQVRRLAVWTQVFLALALGADVLLNGTLARFAVGPLPPLLWGMTLGAEAAALLMLCACLLLRRGASSCAGAALCGLSGLCAAVSAALSALLLWCRLRGLPELDLAVMASDEPAVLVLLKAQTGASGPLLPLLGALFCVALAGAVGQGLALAWHLIRRRADDFGRDYYAFVVAGRSWRAMYAGALVLPFAAVLLWLTGMTQAHILSQPAFSAGWWLWQLGALGLPGAVACWYAMARSQAPLRLKFLAFLALPLLAVGTVCLLARLAV